MIKLQVSYDGRAFWGSQRQAGQRTVQGELETAAVRVFGQEIPVYLAGRTDRGVHAAGQVASFAEPGKRLENSTIVAAMNDHLSADIAVLSVERMPIGFHARYSATWREYRYRIWTGVRQPLAEGWTWQLRSPFDLGAMNRAASRLIGEHDFSSFASGGEGIPGSERSKAKRGARRTILACDVRTIDRWWGPETGSGQLYELRVVADGFLPRMVRGIAGMLAEVGRGTFGETDVTGLIEAADRRKAPKNAPPDGLVLWAVGYAPYDEER
ncbi:MAG: tRNA pseudouridine(38-40) synthase TruA [Thermomicrobiales bacterium]|nr:tRNA pseudouridine(38-40) synthase TruA [Thermomicrobiales bacterium]